MAWSDIVLAWLVDGVVGDPATLHPVVLMGKAISWLERSLCPECAHGGGCTRPVKELVCGAILAVSIIGGSYLAAWTLIVLADMGHRWAGTAVRVWLLAMCLGRKSLGRSAEAVAQRLIAGDIAGARRSVSCIVGRDTEDLSPPEVARAAIESVAENASDGIIAPLFWAALGGAPVAVAYRAVNTLDSMVGYADERYRYFGLVSAKLDDLANLIPSRLTALLFLAAGIGIREVSVLRGWRILRRDAKRHQSPNAGWPEAAVAGLLGVRLGGPNRYRGRESYRPYIGNALAPLDDRGIRMAIKLMHRATAFAVAAASGLVTIVAGIKG